MFFHKILTNENKLPVSWATKIPHVEALLQQKIQQFKDQIFEKKKELEGESPFKEIMENDEEELKKATNAVAEKETEVKSLEAELPYYDYWITGFGDNGIRKWIVDGIIPELNNHCIFTSYCI